MGGEHASRSHITTLSDCAQICATSAAFMMRGSDHQRVRLKIQPRRAAAFLLL